MSTAPSFSSGPVRPVRRVVQASAPAPGLALVPAPGLALVPAPGLALVPAPGWALDQVPAWASAPVRGQGPALAHGLTPAHGPAVPLAAGRRPAPVQGVPSAAGGRRQGPAQAAPSGEAVPLAEADVPAAPSAGDAPAAPSAGEAGAADGAERPGPLIWHAEKKDAGSCVLLFYISSKICAPAGRKNDSFIEIVKKTGKRRQDMVQCWGRHGSPGARRPSGPLRRTPDLLSCGPVLYCRQLPDYSDLPHGGDRPPGRNGTAI